MLLVFIALAALPSQALAAIPPAQTCIPQAMPQAINSAGLPPIATDTIEFAATPSLQYPERAWVVRLSLRRRVEATIEILRLKGQKRCNRYTIESRWQSPLKPGEYAAIASKVVPVVVPAGSVFVRCLTERPSYPVLDGTSIELRLQSEGWLVTRSLNHYSNGGGAISALFRQLALRYVPADELPTEDWRTKPPPEGRFGKPAR